jgi:hypothetical protein
VEPYSDVRVKIAVTRLEPGSSADGTRATTVAYFRYVVALDSDAPLYFKVENVVVTVNGQINTGAYYDSVASVAAQWRLLKRGETAIEAYATFPGAIDPRLQPKISFVDLGLSRSEGEGG